VKPQGFTHAYKEVDREKREMWLDYSEALSFDTSFFGAMNGDTITRNVTEKSKRTRKGENWQYPLKRPQIERLWVISG